MEYTWNFLDGGHVQINVSVKGSEWVDEIQHARLANSQRAKLIRLSEAELMERTGRYFIDDAAKKLESDYGVSVNRSNYNKVEVISAKAESASFATAYQVRRVIDTPAGILRNAGEYFRTDVPLALIWLRRLVNGGYCDETEFITYLMECGFITIKEFRTSMLQSILDAAEGEKVLRREDFDEVFRSSRMFDFYRNEQLPPAEKLYDFTGTDIGVPDYTEYWNNVYEAMMHVDEVVEKDDSIDNGIHNAVESIISEIFEFVKEQKEHAGETFQEEVRQFRVSLKERLDQMYEDVTTWFTENYDLEAEKAEADERFALKTEEYERAMRVYSSSEEDYQKAYGEMVRERTQLLQYRDEAAKELSEITGMFKGRKKQEVQEKIDYYDDKLKELEAKPLPQRMKRPEAPVKEETLSSEESITDAMQKYIAKYGRKYALNDVISFGEGSYEILEWENEYALIHRTSPYAKVSYMAEDKSTSDWQHSTVRDMLKELYNGGLGEDKALVYPCYVKYRVQTDANIYQLADHLFILSKEEMERYYPTPDRRNVPDYTSAPVNQFYWTRTPDLIEGGKQIYVNQHGVLLSDDIHKEYGIRPAMYMKLVDGRTAAGAGVLGPIVRNLMGTRNISFE